MQPRSDFRETRQTSASIISKDGPSGAAFMKSLIRGARGLALALVALVGGFPAWVAISAGQPAQTEEAVPAKAVRVPWTTSRVVGSPDPPPPFKVVRAFPNLKFTHPLLIARPPGSDRLFVGEQDGVLYSFVGRPDARAELFYDLRKEIRTLHLLPGAKEVEAVYGLTFHPDFANNRQCFVCYTIRGKKPGHLADGTRVSRFTVTKTDPPRKKWCFPSCKAGTTAAISTSAPTACSISPPAMPPAPILPMPSTPGRTS